jgi:hypothetical protein
MNGGKEVGGGDGTRIGRRIEGDDVRPGRCEGIDVVHDGADPDGRPREVAFDEAYDRRGGGGADGRHVRDPLDADSDGAARERRKREGDNDFRPVERAAHHRLAGYDQRSAKFAG